MSDEELVKRLRERGGRIPTEAADRIEELGRLARGQGEQLEIQGNELCRRASHGHKQADRIEALEQQVADLLSDVPCACGYDNPTDVCMKHLPLVRNLIEQLETARADTKKAVKALLLARVHVANNEQGWSVGRASARSDLEIINATLAEVEGEKT
jgi:hypothetical protein